MCLKVLLILYIFFQIKRMCWSVVFAAIRQTVDDEYESSQKKDQAAADRATSINAETGQGGLLALQTSSSNISASLAVDSKVAKENIFNAVFRSLAPWVVQALEDATTFAKQNEPRKEDVLKKLQMMNSTSVPTEAASMFATNLWPSLKSRGWKADLITEGDRVGETRYSFKDKEVSSIHFQFVSNVLLI
jgi:hypothetical protein